MVTNTQTRDDQQDRELERRLINFLATRSRPALKRLDVIARQGVVTLRGLVPSFYDRQIAIGCCQRVAGARRVVDYIEVATTAVKTSHNAKP